MNDDQNYSHQDTALPRPAITTEDFQPAPPRQVMTDNEVSSSNEEPWSFMPGHDEAPETMRPDASWQSEQPQADALMATEPLTEPNEQPRPIMTPHGGTVNSNAVGHDMVDSADPITESVATDEPPRSVMTEQPQAEDNVEEKVEEQAKPPAVEVLPDTADLVTVEEAVLIFRELGLPRHMRTIQKYCSRTTGRALISYQVPTENGIRYMIEKASIDRFISYAAQQAPTGKLDHDPPIEPVSLNVTQNREQPAPAASVDHSDIFENPIVQRLESQVERLENRNEQLQSRIQNVLIDANERLIELQKASAVAQSENLGTFLLEAERIRRQEGDQKGDLENDHGLVPPVNGEGERFGVISV